MSSIHTPAAKPHPAHTAAGLVRRWEDCLAPHDLPQWAEDAALTMRALAAQHTAPREEDGGTARAAFEARFSAEPHGLRMDRWGSRAALAGEYKSFQTQFAWEGYQAGRAAPGAAAAAPTSADTERLDWLEARGHKSWGSDYRVLSVKWMAITSLREAIDAARAANFGCVGGAHG